MERRNFVMAGLAGLCGAFAGRKSVDAQEIWVNGQGHQHLRSVGTGRVMPLQSLQAEPLQPVQYYGPSAVCSFNRDQLTRVAQTFVCGFQQALPQNECQHSLNLNVFIDQALRRLQRIGCYGIIMLATGTKLGNAIDCEIESVFDMRGKVTEADLEAAEQFLLAEVDRLWRLQEVNTIPQAIPAYTLPTNGYLPQHRY